METVKVYEECPMCHCRERVVEAEVDKEKADRKIREDRIACSIQKVIPIKDPSGNALIFPVLLAHYDYCAECGYEYPHIITREKMTWEQFQAFLMAMGGGSR